MLIYCILSTNACLLLHKAKKLYGLQTLRVIYVECKPSQICLTMYQWCSLHGTHFYDNTSEQFRASFDQSRALQHKTLGVCRYTFPCLLFSQISQDIKASIPLHVCALSQKSELQKRWQRAANWGDHIK